ncbi:VOC family protein [Allobacillus halotolerans]|uniref:VOC family protein n=1 Tax=Allobacillus halotolerans TaxID=570278 RepID=A0ABS6GNU4_9BACI|nr:VOC family protein [Allobacillus halotolerans]MBU6080762.1 VOC family protein [Allobacillus halotolerans]
MKFHQQPATFVEHVQLKVTDINRSIEFYQKILGFDILDKTSSTANLTANGETAILTIEQPSGVTPKQGRTAGLYHFAILLPTKADLANFVVHISRNNIPIGSSDHDVSEALYFNDPDGNGIEVYYDRDPAEWTWNGEMVHMTVDPLDFDELLKHASQNELWQGMPSDTVMGHLHLHVSEMQTAEEFYVKGLGFNVVNRFGAQALFLSTEDYHHHIAINTWNGVGAPSMPENGAGLKAFTVKYPSEDSRKEAVNRLEKIGTAVSQEGEYWVSVDPSGNRVLLVI